MGVRRRYRFAAVLIVALCCSAPASAAPGDLDPTFSGNGIALGPALPAYPYGEDAVAVQSTGRVIIAAGSTLAAFTDGGESDAAFGLAVGASLGASPPHVVDDIAVDTSDRVLVLLDVDPKVAGLTLLRLHPDGSLDESFGSAGSVALDAGFTGAIAVDPTGGAAVTSGGRLTRLLPTGEPDPGFSADGVVESPRDLYAVAIDPAGRVLVLDYETLVRLAPSGAADPTFGIDGKVTFGTASYGGAADLALGSSGDPYVLGTRCQPDFILYCSTWVTKLDGSGGVVWRSGLQRSSQGVPPRFEPNSLAVDAAGGVVTLNLGESSGLIVNRLTVDGAADPSFGTGKGTSATFPGGCPAGGRAVALDGQGRPVVAAFGCSGAEGVVGRDVIRLRVDSEARNLDADPFPDDRDRCDKYPSEKHRGCGVVDRKLTIKSVERGVVSGSIRDPDYLPPFPGVLRIPPPPLHTYTACESESPIELVRVRPGKDRILAEDTARGKHWELELPDRRKRLIVRAPARVLKGSEKFGGVALCGAARVSIRP